MGTLRLQTATRPEGDVDVSDCKAERQPQSNNPTIQQSINPAVHQSGRRCGARGSPLRRIARCVCAAFLAPAIWYLSARLREPTVAIWECAGTVSVCVRRLEASVRIRTDYLSLFSARAHSECARF